MHAIALPPQVRRYHQYAGTPGTLVPVIVKLTLTPEEATAVDKLREGFEPRATCIKRLVLDAVANQGTTVSGTKRTAQEPREVAVAPTKLRVGRTEAAEPFGRKTKAQVAAITGHKEGCGCNRCYEAEAA